MIRRPPRSTQSRSSAASDVYKRQIAGVDAQRVDVLHGADRDARVLVVAHHLVLDLLPADETLLHHHLADGAGTQAGPHALAVISLHLDDPAAGPAKREGGPDDRRQPDLRQRAIGRGGTLGVRGSLDDRRRRIGLFQAVQQVAELLAILGHLDRPQRRAEEPDAMAFQDPGLRQGHRQVERRLAAEAGEEAVGLLAGDHRLDRRDGERLEVDGVGDCRIGHDRGRVRVHEDRPDTLRAQGAACLGAGVVELGGLADDHGSRADDQDRAGLRRAGPRGSAGARWSLAHPRDSARARAAATKRSKTASASRGPGAPSGWYCTVSIGSERWRSPSTEPSFRFTWLTMNPPSTGSVAPSTVTSWFWAVTWTRPISTSRTGWFAP